MLQGIDKRRLQIQWMASGDPLEPFQAEVGGDHCGVQINDFPDEDLYTLLINGEVAMRFSDWPESWKKPSTAPGFPTQVQPKLKKTG
ncbi:MAG: hypothetical protein ABI995_01550 [Acidobacteriota bacterium]